MEQVKVNVEEIMTKLARLQTDMDYVREHIEDITLTEDDLSSLEEAEKELKEGKTTSLEDLKKELAV
jgi:prefoldin subunit 5